MLKLLHPSWRYLEAPNAYTLLPNSLLQVALTGEVPGHPDSLSPTARLVLVALASRARLRAKAVGEVELAGLLGLDRRTVRKALEVLWEARLVEVEPPGRYRLADGLLGTGEVQALPTTLHAVHEDLQGLHRTGGENALLDGAQSALEVKEEVKEKNPPHPPTQAEDEEEAFWDENLKRPEEASSSQAVTCGQSAPPVPYSGSKAQVLSPPSPALVKDSTRFRPLQEALKAAGLWRDFYRAFRPGFASEALWAAYLARLEREALPKGEVFLQALALTLRGVAQGGVRYPARYLEAVMADLEARTPTPPPPPQGAGEPELLDGVLLCLPDGRRGYFAGWTGGGAKAFVEVDGVAHLVDREAVLAARVLE
jgi:DNA-binding transcriptional ArsR family regulator